MANNSIYNASAADLLQLADYKDKWGTATTDEARLRYSKAADQLRSQLGINQGGGAIGGTYSGNYTADELRRMANQSSIKAIPVTQKTVDAQRPQMIGGDDLSAMFGITNNRKEMEGIYRDAVDQAYEARYNQQGIIEDNYYDQLGQSQLAVQDTLKKATNTAIASGASRGMQAANQIAAALGISQQGVTTATQLAQDRAGLADSQKADIAQAIRDALDGSNIVGQGLATTAANVYGYDSSNYAAELGANSNDYASIMGYLAQQYASDKALQGTEYTSDANKEAAALQAASYAASARSGGSSYTPQEEEEAKGFLSGIIPGFDNLSPELQTRMVLQYMFQDPEVVDGMMGDYTKSIGRGTPSKTNPNYMRPSDIPSPLDLIRQNMPWVQPGSSIKTSSGKPTDQDVKNITTKNVIDSIIRVFAK